MRHSSDILGVVQISLANKSAIVTGAGRGIGRAIAETLAKTGASVLLTDIDEPALEEAKAALESAAPGAKLSTIAGDVTAPKFPEAIVARAVKDFGGLDIIVNNAGYTWDSVIQKTTDEQFQAMLDIHVVAPFRLLRAAAPGCVTPQRRKRKRENRDAQSGEHHVYLWLRWQCGAVGLLFGQIGHRRPDEDHCERMGTL